MTTIRLHITFLLLSSLIGATYIGQMITVNLVAKMNGVFMDESGQNVNYWGYGIFEPGGPYKPSLPAPLLEFNQGDSITLHFLNDSPEAHTIHLHGLDVNQINDGVGHTSMDVMPGETYDYVFKATHSGSYLYHCHVMSPLHVAMGMYGMISINGPDSLYIYENGPGYNKKYHFLTSEMYTHWNFNLTSPGPFYLYDPDYFMINGKSGTQLFENNDNIIEALPGDSIVLHLANIAYSMVEYIFPEGCNAQVYMSDGRAIPQPFSADTLRLYAGERFAVILKPATIVEDYITVNYLSMYEDTFEGVNYIGINSSGYPVGISPDELLHFKMYPNPASSSLMIDLPNLTNGILQVVNLQGKLLLIKNLTTATIHELNVSHLANGTYLVVISTENQHLVQKLIIQR
jgi:FtsP/CotA-like multicopper oxidase with cupredoxin domain